MLLTLWNNKYKNTYYLEKLFLFIIIKLSKCNFSRESTRENHFMKFNTYYDDDVDAQHFSKK